MIIFLLLVFAGDGMLLQHLFGRQTKIPCSCIPQESRQSDIWKFYDPAKRISYTLKVPGLQKCSMCYSKDGWLLLIEIRTFRYFLYCPYTRESVYLPDKAETCERVAFSAPPTSPGCVIFAITEVGPNSVAVRTCRPGDAAWTTAHYHCSEPFLVRLPSQAVYCDGFFYCLSKSGYLGFFNPENGIWGVLSVPRSIGNKVFPTDIADHCIYIAEYNGDIYIMYTYAFSEPLVHKLDKANHQWELVEDLGGLTIFGNFRTPVICTDMVGIIRNSIYFSKVLNHGRGCIVYSFNQARFLPRKEGYKLSGLEDYQNIWVDPPKDLSIFN